MSLEHSVRETAASVLNTVIFESEDAHKAANAPGYECSLRRRDGSWQLTILGVLNGLLAKQGKSIAVMVEEESGELLHAEIVDVGS